MPDRSSLREKTKQLAGWFLGPKAENAETEEKLMNFILQDYFHWRRNYFPSDEIVIPQKLRRELVDWNDDLAQKIAEMLAGLRKHFPFYSPRYMAHMVSDQTLPSILGYFAGLLYNPNNVTPEAAPVTERWEFEVGRDMLEMLGYKAPPPAGQPHEDRLEFGWAHLTSGGTVANIEALWAARNAAYFPLAVEKLAREFGLQLEGVEQLRLGMTTREIVHLLPQLLEAICRRLKLSRADAIARMGGFLSSTGYSIPHNGIARCFAKSPPALFVSGTKHYSIYKAADLLGIGRENVILVDVDGLFRLDIRDLEDKMRNAIKRGMLPVAVVAIAGTTEEGAVDPVHGIVDLRHQFEQDLHASFWLHVDAAWGGYIRSLFIPSESGGEHAPESLADHIESVSRFVSRQVDLSDGAYSRLIPIQWGNQDVISAFLALPKADSIAVDPHKLGYVPYPCGVVAFKSDRVRQFLAEAAPYLASTVATQNSKGDHTPPTSIGPYILEGSKPGAAVAGVWLSHRMIPLNRDGYGEIVRASILAARELYERIVHWEHWANANHIDADFEFVPLMREPPDTNIVCFVVKEKGSTSLSRQNALNQWIYEHFTIETEHGPGEYSYSQPFFLSHTIIQYPAYSQRSMTEPLERLGIDSSDYREHGLFVLRATLMNPYIVLAEETGRRGRAYLAQFMEKLSARAVEGIAAIHQGVQAIS